MIRGQPLIELALHHAVTVVAEALPAEAPGDHQELILETIGQPGASGIEDEPAFGEVVADPDRDQPGLGGDAGIQSAGSPAIARGDARARRPVAVAVGLGQQSPRPDVAELAVQVFLAVNHPDRATERVLHRWRRASPSCAASQVAMASQK